MRTFDRLYTQLLGSRGARSGLAAHAAALVVRPALDCLARWNAAASVALAKVSHCSALCCYSSIWPAACLFAMSSPCGASAAPDQAGWSMLGPATLRMRRRRVPSAPSSRGRPGSRDSRWSAPSRFCRPAASGRRQAAGPRIGVPSVKAANVRTGPGLRQVPAGQRRLVFPHGPGLAG
jgi:hypothetical protein